MAVQESVTLTQGQLIWRRFKKHRLAMVGAVIVILLYIIVLGADFFSTHSPDKRFSQYTFMAPQKIHIRDEEGFRRPFVYGLQRQRNPVTFAVEYTIDYTKKHPIRFFVCGETSYKFLGLFQTNLRLFGTDSQPLFLFGTDRLGRDVYSRILAGGRVSLTIGLVGVALSLVLGLVFGGLSGYYGGVVDDLIQRCIEFLMCVPTIPLWMALAATMPVDWPITYRYFAITVILSVVGWTGLARVVRGKILSLKTEGFVLAARSFGAADGFIIARHLIPNFMSYILVTATLAIPGMILGETALSFLGLGLRPPAVSWGILLQDAQNIQAVSNYPWLFTPAVFVVIAVLAFNFVGDGLRDSVDPHK